jgi:NADP-dependent 3-hydroxy acid dehydrogenase YdfG
MTKMARLSPINSERRFVINRINNSGATYTHCDVTKWADLLELHDLAIKTYHTIDVVVPNAGVNEVEDLFEDKFDENGRLLPPKHILNEVNLKGVLNSILGNYQTNL